MRKVADLHFAKIYWAPTLILFHQTLVQVKVALIWGLFLIFSFAGESYIAITQQRFAWNTPLQKVYFRLDYSYIVQDDF